MTQFREVANGLEFPEGPVALPDGDLLVVEIAAGALTRIDRKAGRKTRIATPGGGPNGAAIGPDGACYVCNNGGFGWHRSAKGQLFPHGIAPDYSGGRIERVDLATGKVERLYDKVDGNPLNGPNDLVFDSSGGFWFTDPGKDRGRVRDNGGLYYAQPDGSSIREVMFPVPTPNGVGLSRDEKRLYGVDSSAGRVWAWDLEAPGSIARVRGAPYGATLIGGIGGYQLFDSLAIDSAGNICVATIGTPSGISVFSPQGELLEQIELPDLFTTNICFGGPELKTAFVTLSATGRLVALDWPRPGLALPWLNYRPG